MVVNPPHHYEYRLEGNARYLWSEKKSFSAKAFFSKRLLVLSLKLYQRCTDLWLSRWTKSPLKAFQLSIWPKDGCLTKKNWEDIWSINQSYKFQMIIGSICLFSQQCKVSIKQIVLSCSNFLRKNR